MLPARTAKYGSNVMFNLFEVISRTEVEDQTGKPGVWRLGLPHACNGIAGELTDYRIDKIIWNIDGKLVPRHGIRNPTGFCLELPRRSISYGCALSRLRFADRRYFVDSSKNGRL